MGKHSKKSKQQKIERKKAGPRGYDERKEAASTQEMRELAHRASALNDQHAKICASLQCEEIKKKRANLVMLELQEFRNEAGSGRMFRGIGRCFLLSTDEEVTMELEETVAHCDRDIPTYRAIQAQFETKMRLEKENMRLLANELAKMKVS
eukprot:GEMP01068329.1.p1 GENE.GEMP01068329.1~~GEMP01068329.1.p1  ORF type:complete len:151 (+),score=35.10 GEMP01068329.1:27-479(+)